MRLDVANTPLKRRTDERPGLATGDHREKSFIFLRRPTYPGHQFPFRFLCLGQASLCGADAAHHERLYRHINDRLLSLQVNAPSSAPSSQANLARKILFKNDPVAGSITVGGPFHLSINLHFARAPRWCPPSLRAAASSWPAGALESALADLGSAGIWRRRPSANRQQASIA